uniref:Uncharacterized protein n=1 Tax=Oryza barthii TaxID=65489 RepID=A0A0D3F728_9ORYZ
MEGGRTGARGASGGGGGRRGVMRRGQRWRPRCEEELPVWRGLRHTKAGWQGVSVQWSHMSAEVERWWSIDVSAVDSQRVKTQPGFGRTDNDGSFPLPRALSCHLIPQGLGSFEPLTDGGSGFPSLLSLETSAFFWAFPFVFRCSSSGGRSGISLLAILCVGAVGVWVV